MDKEIAKSLYKDIMNEIAKVVKRKINEACDTEKLNEDTIHSKKRRVNDIEKAFKKGKIGFDAIRSIVVFTAENPDSKEQSSKLNKKANHDLLKQLKDANYKFVPAVGKFGNSEHPYVIINMSLSAAKNFCGKNEQTSFVFTKFNKKNKSVHSEYWEKKDATKKYHKTDNDYVMKDESDKWEDRSEAEDMYTIIGNKFKYSIPFSIFESIDNKMLDNIENYFRATDNNFVNENIDEFLDFAINRVGFTPAMYRKVLTKELLSD